jgi:hypothetical protein
MELDGGAKALIMPDHPLPTHEWGPYTLRSIRIVNGGGLTARDVSLTLLQSGTVGDMAGEYDIEWKDHVGSADALGAGESKAWTLVVLDNVPQFTIEMAYKSILFTRKSKRTFDQERDYL